MTTLEARLAALTPTILSVFRIVFGLLFVMHGTQKLFGWPIATPMPVLSGSLVWWAAIIELIGGGLILIGLVTRFAAFICSGEMAFAYFTQFQPAGFWPIVNEGELAVAYCFAFFLLIFAGGGAWSLDAVRARR